MPNRRTFIKILIGLGALTLPWTALPLKFSKSVQALIGKPAVELILPPPVKTAETKTDVLSKNAMEDIEALTGPLMKGRKAGTQGEARAASYLIQQMNSLGLMPLGEGGGFAQAFTIPPLTEKVINGRLTFRSIDKNGLRTPCINLLGALEGKDTNEIIVISAHYDHLGVFEDQVYPGANDNASGVACVLDVMRRLKREKTLPEKTVVFAFWSAEEMGFLGSNAFVQNPTFPLKKIHAVLNVDTVGNGPIGEFALWADEENTAVKALRKAAASAHAHVKLTPSNGHNSDQITFARAGIPAATLMAKNWLYKNHTPEDNIRFINSDQIKMASDIIYKTVYTLAY